MTRFNLNADMAEGFGDWQMGNDDGLLGIINTANIACGFHAGDYNIMGDVMTKAAASGVSVGAHPGFYDLHGFGRRKLHLSEAEIERLIAYQLGATIAIGQLSGIAVTHIKPHGAINNMACADRALADAIVRGTSAVDQNIILLAPVLSELYAAGEAAGLPVAGEVFADRAYMPDGQLVPRSRPDAMIHDKAESLAQCVRMFCEHTIVAVDGTALSVKADSVCVHGDGPQAVEIAGFIKAGLEAEGLQPTALPDMLG
ncbi:MAG: LamB/YcsF family protein [Candidatus Puniceispirillaceae bacterium]